jgi:putative toxin-antitoxin system antitoxin component (TIGR02293 family)
MATPARRARAHPKKVPGPSWQPFLHGKRPIGSIFAVAPMGRVDLVKQGMPAEVLRLLAADMGVTRDQLYSTLGVPRATMERKLREDRRLNQDESERVVGLARLIGQVEQTVQESGDPAGFHAARWLAGWLAAPLPALGGRPPGELMDTAEGREIVAGLISQIGSGAYG